MSNIDPDIIDPGKPQTPPGGLPPAIDPENDLAEPDDIREPDADDLQPIEPDPEEADGTVPVIRA